MSIELPNRLQGDLEGGYFWQDELFFGQCDKDMNVKMSTLLDQMVTVSSQHCRSFGMTYEAFLAGNTAFVLCRASFLIHRLPKCFELLTVQTWIDGIKGPYYQRVVQWMDETGAVAVSSRSDWVVLQLDTRTLQKARKEDSRFVTKSPVSLPPCIKIKLQDMELQPVGTHVATWSEIDGNGHLHSANYGDILWNSLPEKLQGKIPREFHMEFQKEVLLGESIQISYVQPSETECFLQGECNGGMSFKGKILF